jgi:hypothetical protein
MSMKNYIVNIYFEVSLYIQIIDLIEMPLEILICREIFSSKTNLKRFHDSVKPLRFTRNLITTVS